MPLSVIEFDDYDLSRFIQVASVYGNGGYGYVVTPNADHLIRLDQDPGFRALYADAQFVLLDSRFLSKLIKLFHGIGLPVCAGSDLTAHLFAEIVDPGDKLVLIGGRPEQIDLLKARYRLTNLAHHNPPMGFIRDPRAVETCLEFIEAHSPFRFCLLGVGAPQQEVVAHQLKLRGVARGMALCIGASIDFLTGVEKRAPQWVQKLGMEWLFRLAQSPRRLARRYLVRGPKVFGLLRRTRIVLRPASSSGSK